MFFCDKLMVIIQFLRCEMKTNRKVKFTILIIVCCSVLACNIMLAIGCSSKNYLDLCAETWDITFPQDAQLEYNYSDIEWMDGERYGIVKFDSRPDEFLQSFSNEKSNIDWDCFEFALEHLVEHGLDESKVVILDENFIYYSKDNGDTPRDILFLLYDESLNTLYIVESFI